MSELEERLGIRQPTLSQQLGLLRENDIVAMRRDGESIFYSIVSQEAIAMMSVLYDQFCANNK